MQHNEANLQAAIVKYCRSQYPELRLDANPQSGGIGWGNLNQIQRGRQAQKMRAQGFEKSRPDLYLLFAQIIDKKLWGGIAMEVKKKEENPFRLMRNGKMWIEGSKSEKVDHFLDQFAFLDAGKPAGLMPFVCSSFDRAKQIIDWYMSPEGLPIEIKKYRFSYGMRSDREVWY